MQGCSHGFQEKFCKVEQDCFGALCKGRDFSVKTEDLRYNKATDKFFISCSTEFPVIYAFHKAVTSKYTKIVENIPPNERIKIKRLYTKASGPFIDSHAASWLSTHHIDVPTDPPSHRPWLLSPIPSTNLRNL